MPPFFIRTGRKQLLDISKQPIRNIIDDVTVPGRYRLRATGQFIKAAEARRLTALNRYHNEIRAIRRANPDRTFAQAQELRRRFKEEALGASPEELEELLKEVFDSP